MVVSGLPRRCVRRPHSAAYMFTFSFTLACRARSPPPPPASAHGTLLARSNGDAHAAEIASMALHLSAALHAHQMRVGHELQLRIGIHTGAPRTLPSLPITSFTYHYCLCSASLTTSVHSMRCVPSYTSPELLYARTASLMPHVRLLSARRACGGRRRRHSHAALLSLRRCGELSFDTYCTSPQLITCMSLSSNDTRFRLLCNVLTLQLRLAQTITSPVSCEHISYLTCR